MIRTEDGVKLVPELYTVPSEHVVAEYSDPGSQERIPLGLCPFLWAQSLYIVGKLLQEVICFYYFRFRFYKIETFTGIFSTWRIRSSQQKTLF